MGMTESWDGFRGLQATREEKSRVIPSGSKTIKPRRSKTGPKSKEKEMGKIQGVTRRSVPTYIKDLLMQSHLGRPEKALLE